MTSICKKWLDRINAPTIGHGSVIQLARGVYPLSRGYTPGGKVTNLTQDEAEIVVDAIHYRARSRDGGPRAEERNEDRGRKWLTDNERRLDLPRLAWPDITEFRLRGFYVYGENRWGIDAAPVWRCTWEHFPGLTFDYAPTAWQGSLAYGKVDSTTFWWQREGVSA